MQNNNNQPSALSYFGKVPCRGDFVKSSHNPELVKRLDTWVSKAVGEVAKDPHWKQIFPDGKGVDFAIMGSKDKLMLTGSVRHSRDSSNRLYPFVAASTYEVSEPANHIPLAPLLFNSYWNTLDLWLKQSFNQDDGAGFVKTLDTFPLEQNVFDAVEDTETLRKYMQWNKLSDISKSLQFGVNILQFERIVIALGVLFHPLLSGSTLALEKGIRLPLPADSKAKKKCASFWLSLLMVFFKRTDREVCVFFPKGEGDNYMLVGFESGSEHLLASLLDNRLQSNYFVSLEAPVWVDSESDEDYAIAKLKGYLKQPQLTLEQLFITYSETFTG